MKRALSQFLAVNLTLLIAVALVGVQAKPAAAERNLANIVNDLAYPTNSERFFDQGRQQLETESRNLQQHALTQPILLRIDPEIEQQQQIWQKQQEQQLEEMLHQSDDRSHATDLL